MSEVDAQLSPQRYWCIAAKLKRIQSCSLGPTGLARSKLRNIEGAQADIADIAVGKTAKPHAGSRACTINGGEGEVSRTISTVHAIFEHAVLPGRIETKPLRDVRK